MLIYCISSYVFNPFLNLFHAIVFKGEYMYLSLIIVVFKVKSSRAGSE